MLRYTFILLPVLLSAVSAKFYIEELKPSSGNEYYKNALNLIRNYVSALKSKQLKKDEIAELKDQNIDSEPVKILSPSHKITPSNLVPVRSLAPLKAHSEEQLSNMVLEKFRAVNAENNLVPVKVWSSESEEIQQLSSVRPVKVYSDREQRSNLVPGNVSSLESEEMPSNLVHVRSFHPVKVYSEDNMPSNLVPVKEMSLESDEMYPSNVVLVRSLRPVKDYNENLRSNLALHRQSEEQPSDLVPIKESEETQPSNLVPFRSLRTVYANLKDSLCETNKFYFRTCTDTCKRAVHQACRNYKCASEHQLNHACEQRCQFRYP